MKYDGLTVIKDGHGNWFVPDGAYCITPQDSTAYVCPKCKSSYPADTHGNSPVQKCALCDSKLKRKVTGPVIIDL